MTTSYRLSQAQYVGDLQVMLCWCGVGFALPETLYREYRARKVHSIFCPLGHSMIPAGKTDAQLLDEERARARTRESALRDQLQASERSKSALRGQVTKAKRRAAAGLCPCCSRSFVALKRHIETKHPDYVVEASS